MFSSQKSRERTKKTKEVKIDLINKKQKAKKYLILWSKIWQTLTSLFKKKVKYERGVPLQLVTAARGCRRMAETWVPQQLQSRSPLCKGATVPPGDGHIHDGWQVVWKAEEELAEVTIKETPERTVTKMELCWSAGHTKESHNLFNCLNKQIS